MGRRGLSCRNENMEAARGTGPLGGPPRAPGGLQPLHEGRALQKGQAALLHAPRQGSGVLSPAVFSRRGGRGDSWRGLLQR